MGGRLTATTTGAGTRCAGRTSCGN
jgi:hypothetical protein